MKQPSYLIFTPAVQDRFWSRQAPREQALERHGDQHHSHAARLAHDVSKNLRKKIPFDALVDYWITYSIPWHILELGMESALVKMDTLGLRVGEPTDFVLRFKCDRQPTERHIPTVVEKIEAQGVTLRFVGVDDETRRDMARLLRVL